MKNLTLAEKIMYRNIPENNEWKGIKNSERSSGVSVFIDERYCIAIDEINDSIKSIILR